MNSAICPGETVPGAAALSDWAKASGMWSRALRLRWRHLMHLSGTGPVVLLFNDGTAGLLTGANPEAKIVGLKDPRAPEADPAIMVDEMRLAEVWSGETILLRTERGSAEADPPFTVRWLFKMMMGEKKSLGDLFIASLALSFLTIVPPLIVMSIIDKVITHHSFSTLFLMSVILGIMVVYETLLGFARRLIIAVVGVRTDARLNLHVFARLIRLPLDYFERHPGRRDDVQGQPDPPGAALHHRQTDDDAAGPDHARGAAAVPVLAERHAGLDRAGLRDDRAADHPGLPAADARGLRPGDRGGDRQAVRAGRDGLRHQDRQVPGAGAATQGAVGRARGRGRQMAARVQQAGQLAADAGHADRAVHVDGHHSGRRLSGADRRRPGFRSAACSPS